MVHFNFTIHIPIKVLSVIECISWLRLSVKGTFGTCDCTVFSVTDKYLLFRSVTWNIRIVQSATKTLYYDFSRTSESYNLQRKLFITILVEHS